MNTYVIVIFPFVFFSSLCLFDSFFSCSVIPDLPLFLGSLSFTTLTLSNKID